MPEPDKAGFNRVLDAVAAWTNILVNDVAGTASGNFSDWC
jgi:hypothetical protein